MLSVVGSASEHALVSYHTYCIKVNYIPVIHLTHDLGCHIARSSTHLVCKRDVVSPHLCNAHVSDPQIAFVVKNEIFRLNVSVYNLLRMHEFQSLNYACDKKLRLLLSENGSHDQMIAEVTASMVLHHQVKIFFVLKRVNHVNNKLVLQVSQ